MNKIFGVFFIIIILSGCSTIPQQKLNSNYNNYKDSLKQGVWVEMNDSLQMMELCKYNKGIKNGKYYRFFEDGAIAVKGRYKNGKKHGWWYSGGAVGGANKYRNGTIIESVHHNPRF
jgi:antitoxin component YwqK of YwqJK toxin-antitoxin module